MTATPSYSEDGYYMQEACMELTQDGEDITEGTLRMKLSAMTGREWTPEMIESWPINAIMGKESSKGRKGKAPKVPKPPKTKAPKPKAPKSKGRMIIEEVSEEEEPPNALRLASMIEPPPDPYILDDSWPIPGRKKDPTRDKRPVGKRKPLEHPGLPRKAERPPLIPLPKSGDWMLDIAETRELALDELQQDQDRPHFWNDASRDKRSEDCCTWYQWLEEHTDPSWKDLAANRMQSPSTRASAGTWVDSGQAAVMQPGWVPVPAPYYVLPKNTQPEIVQERSLSPSRGERGAMPHRDSWADEGDDIDDGNRGRTARRNYEGEPDGAQPASTSLGRSSRPLVGEAGSRRPPLKTEVSAFEAAQMSSPSSSSWAPRSQAGPGASKSGSGDEAAPRQGGATSERVATRDMKSFDWSKKESGVQLPAVLVIEADGYPWSAFTPGPEFKENVVGYSWVDFRLPEDTMTDEARQIAASLAAGGRGNGGYGGRGVLQGAGPKISKKELKLREKEAKRREQQQRQQQRQQLQVQQQHQLHHHHLLPHLHPFRDPQPWGPQVGFEDFGQDGFVVPAPPGASSGPGHQGLRMHSAPGAGGEAYGEMGLDGDGPGYGVYEWGAHDPTAQWDWGEQMW